MLSTSEVKEVHGSFKACRITCKVIASHVTVLSVPRS